jgi:hypothetical protein
VSGHYAYVADDCAGLQVIDVSNPTNLVHVGRCDINGYAVAVSGHYAYVADGDAGLQVLYLQTNPPTKLSLNRADLSMSLSCEGMATGRLYQIETSADLKLWNMWTNFTGTATIFSAPITPGTSMQFYRLRDATE